MYAEEVDFSILPEVLVEVQEHLNELERDLHRLVQDPVSNDLLSSAFRHMHTIKGDFSYCHAAPIADFVHQLEGVLQSLRERKFQCSALVAEALVQSMDQVQSMMDTLARSKRFDGIARGVLTGHIKQLAQARGQESADQAARQILLTIHDEFLGERDAEVASAPAVSAESIVRATALGEQLAQGLALRMPRWKNRIHQQRNLVLALNERYPFPTPPETLTIAVYWHDVGLLAAPDAHLQSPPQPKSPDWAAYSAHPERAATWLLSIAPDCTEVAQIIRQHHLWANGAGIAAPAYGLPPHQGAMMLACADMLHDNVAGLSGEDYRRGVLRTLFDVTGGLETRFDAALINAFEAVAHDLTQPTG
ncbi:Hpt domain-containing protein [Formivibrio citricus]|uniref:Hpt domain-containing protein n=1 Tax=Formivibrio citricus TaxID=83765 RepID=A0A1I4X7U6_9NEIS|nr:Hpt domain-containing protein [Formivibrio citricus]SFN21967.1 Hpt domain-containing protein [Formivibrio citricus]